MLRAKEQSGDTLLRQFVAGEKLAKLERLCKGLGSGSIGRHSPLSLARAWAKPHTGARSLPVRSIWIPSELATATAAIATASQLAC